MITRRLAIMFLAAATASVSYGTVYFQNDGSRENWPNYPQQPEAQGTVNDTNTPTFAGPTAIWYTQTWQPNYTGRYHSEVDYQNTQGVSASRYYGMSVYLPSNWVYTNSNVCIQQWAGNSPWLMMEIRGNSLVVLPHIAGVQTLQSMPRGQWVNIVTYLNTSPTSGAMTVWVNGVQKMNLTGNFSPTNSGGTEVRWSTGAYVTGWYGVTTQPTPNFIQLYGDHYRIADTQSEADPANWNEVYEVQNVASSLALNVSGAATTNNAAVIQWPFNGSANSLWTFTSTGNGYYQMVNQNSGLDAVVSHAATTNGAPIIQYSFGSSGNDQWTPLQNSDMTWTFHNLKSGKVLDDPGSSTAQGTQMDQWSSNGGSNQHWKLILQ